MLTRHGVADGKRERQMRDTRIYRVTRSQLESLSLLRDDYPFFNYCFATSRLVSRETSDRSIQKSTDQEKLSTLRELQMRRESSRNGAREREKRGTAAVLGRRVQVCISLSSRPCAYVGERADICGCVTLLLGIFFIFLVCARSFTWRYVRDILARFRPRERERRDAAAHVTRALTHSRVPHAIAPERETTAFAIHRAAEKIKWCARSLFLAPSSRPRQIRRRSIIAVLLPPRNATDKTRG